MRPPRDRAGLGCMHCDPVVRATTYGGPGDSFVRVTDSLNADGTISPMVVAKGYVGAVDVKVSFSNEGAPK